MGLLVRNIIILQEVVTETFEKVEFHIGEIIDSSPYAFLESRALFTCCLQQEMEWHVHTCLPAQEHKYIHFFLLKIFSIVGIFCILSFFLCFSIIVTA